MPLAIAWFANGAIGGFFFEDEGLPMEVEYHKIKSNIIQWALVIDFFEGFLSDQSWPDFHRPVLLLDGCAVMFFF